MNGPANRRRAMAAVLAIIVLAANTGTVFGVDNQTPIGSHDGALDEIAYDVGCYANGWAVDPDDPDTDVTVRILSDGVEIATVLASAFRQDLLDAGISDGTAAFWVDLTSSVSPGISHSILTQARDLQTGQWVDLDFTPRTLTCTGLGGFHDTAGGTSSRADCRVEGWAFDRDNPTSRVRVRIVVDGRAVAETTADRFRQDVLDAGIGDGFSGWSVDLFGRMTPNREHVVVAEARDTSNKRIWLPLSETGKSMTCVASA